MKKFVFSLFAVAILVGCQSNKQQNADNGAVMEIVEADSTGLVDMWAYEGIVPSMTNKQDSVAYLVIITQKLDSVNGVYQMTTTYITAEDSIRQKVINSRGRKLAHRGTAQDKNAAVYKLVPDSGSNQTVNLWVESDTTVVLLDNQLNSPTHPEKYRLKSRRNREWKNK